MKNGNRKNTPQREAAFDLYCQGLSLRQVQERLADESGDAAPSFSTLKRWSTEGDWVARRGRIHDALGEQRDHARLLYGMDYIAAVTQLREKLLSDAVNLKVHSGDQAIYALVALEKLINDLTDREGWRQHNKERYPGYLDLLEQVDNLLNEQLPPPRVDMSALVKEHLEQNPLHDDTETEPE